MQCVSFEIFENGKTNPSKIRIQMNKITKKHKNPFIFNAAFFS